MIKYVWWRHHAKNEEEHDDSKLLSIIETAIYLNDYNQAFIESITLSDGTVLDGIVDIEEYYDEHKRDDITVDGSAVVIDETRLLGTRQEGI